MTHRSRRGAARVNVIWMVVVVVAFFASLGLLFATSSDVTALQEQNDSLRSENASLTEKASVQFDKVRELSEVIGYYDLTAASARSDLTAMQAGLDLFKRSFPPEMGADVNSFEVALTRSIPAHRQLAVKITNLDQTIATLQAEVQQKAGEIQQLTSTKDGQISDLQTQLADAKNAANTRQNDLEGQVASVRSTLGDTESDLTRVRGEMDDASRTSRDRELEHQARNKELGRKLEVFLREPEKSDGKIIATSDGLNLGWINLGKENRLFAGMGFTIVSGTPGDNRVKGWAEVTDVQDGMAEVALMRQADPFDPPTAGDLIYNPLYDPRGGRNAVMLGRFSGTYNANELKALLSEINIQIQDKLDKTTDFLIVGSELYEDEDGEPLEEPKQPSEMGVYKEAEAMGVQIVPVKIVRDYFRRTSL